MLMLGADCRFQRHHLTAPPPLSQLRQNHDEGKSELFMRSEISVSTGDGVSGNGIAPGTVVVQVSRGGPPREDHARMS